MTTALSDQLAVRRARGVAAPANQPTIFDLIQRMEGQFRTALPKQLPAEKFVRVAMTTLRQKPDLLRCDQNSLLAALMLSAQLGLEPGSPLGHAYLVPYKSEITFVIGYRGYIDLARRSGLVSSVYAEGVYEGDRFEVRKGLNRDIIHEPAWGEQNEKTLKFVYAVAKYGDGSDPDFVVLSKGRVDSYRKRSKASGNGPWVTDYEAMALKTAVRRLATWLPMSTELARAVAADETVITPDTTIDTFDALPPASDPVDDQAATVVDQETGEIKPSDGAEAKPDAEADGAQGDLLGGQR